MLRCPPPERQTSKRCSALSTQALLLAALLLGPLAYTSPTSAESSALARQRYASARTGIGLGPPWCRAWDSGASWRQNRAGLLAGSSCSARFAGREPSREWGPLTLGIAAQRAQRAQQPGGYRHVREGNARVVGQGGSVSSAKGIVRTDLGTVKHIQTYLSTTLCV